MHFSSTIAAALLAAACVPGCAMDPDAAGDSEETTGETTQAVNGDDWTTILNFYSGSGPGTALNAVAASPVTHTILAVGETSFDLGNGSSISEWAVFRNAVGSTTWSQTVGPFATSEADAATADSQGNFFVGGKVRQASGSFVGQIRRSTDDGQTWTTVLTTPEGDITSISPDGSGNLFALADGHAIYRSTNHGTSWTRVYQVRPNPYTRNSNDGLFKLCRVTKAGVTEVVATGTRATGDDSSNLWAMESTDGTTFHTIEDLDMGTVHRTVGTDCAGGNGLLSYSAWTIDGPGPIRSLQWLGFVDNALIDEPAGEVELALTTVFNGTNGNFYVSGVIGDNWVTRVFTPTGWRDSAIWSLSGGSAVAEDSWHDPVRGVIVVGESSDSQGHGHGIVRQLAR